jgi:hypothetical protein
MQRSRDKRINNDVMQPVSGQRIGKHVPAATNRHATVLLVTVFLRGSYKGIIRKTLWETQLVESWVLPRRDGAIFQLTVQLWDIRRTVMM